MDVHGAGSQRSDPKSGSASEYPTGHGPQGDAIRIENYVRCVTGGTDGNVQVGGAVDNTPVTQEGPPAGQTLRKARDKARSRAVGNLHKKRWMPALVWNRARPAR